MRLLSGITDARGAVISMPEFNSYLADVEQALYDRGWTVIGSVFKASKLHPWKQPPRELIHTWAQQNLKTMRANSLNLRLADNNVLALDCDFNDAALMAEFVARACKLLDMPKDHLFTCAGKKGGKLFFRYISTTPCDRIPQRLGSVVYTRGHAGEKDYKQELEIKRDLSTVAGLYGPLGDDMIIYASYDDYPYICAAAPSDLLTINRQNLMLLSELYTQLTSKMGFESSAGTIGTSAAEHEFARACVLAVFLVAWLFLAYKQQISLHDVAVQQIWNRLGSKSSFDIYDQYFKPFFETIGQNAACVLFEHVFRNYPLTIAGLEQDAAKITQICSIQDPAQLEIAVRSTGPIFLNGVAEFQGLLETQASLAGLEGDNILELWLEMQKASINNSAEASWSN